MIFSPLSIKFLSTLYIGERFHKLTVGYQKITEDKASDANLPDAEIAFQPQTRTSRSNVRRGPRVLCQMRTSANSAFQLKRKSEQLRVPTQTRASELHVSISE